MANHPGVSVELSRRRFLALSGAAVGVAAVGGTRLAASAAELSHHGPFLPAQSSVVLLAALPGDLESENTYRDQLQTWLAILEAGGQAQRIFALCDNPESVSSITNSPRRSAGARRGQWE